MVGHIPIRAGRRIREHSSALTIAMVSRMPMLAVPGWLESEILPNEPIVVRAEKTMALGVEEAINDFASLVWRSRITKWMFPAMPSPKSRGRTITLAKLKGSSNSP
mgnify:CR=1 FL=1